MKLIPRRAWRVTLALSALTWAAVSATPAARTPRPLDLASTAGFTQTCATLPASAAALANDDERIAWAVCRDVDLVRQVLTELREVQQRHHELADDVLQARIEQRVDQIREDLRRTRLQLERVNLKGRKSIRLAPGQWQLDLDGDGRIEPWEAHLFALPRREHGEAHLGMPSNDPGYYAQRYDLDAQIAVDQSDVLWALAYHQFLEGLLSNLRAFDVDLHQMRLRLARPALLHQAHALIGQGLATSERLRRSVLAEKSDDHEWLANPAQHDSVFPVPLDADDFRTWGDVLRQLQAVWQGRQLLPANRRAGGLIGELAPVCVVGQGLDVSRLYHQTSRSAEFIELGALRQLARDACRPVDAAHPMAQLDSLLARGAAGSQAGLRMLRYLYWIN